VVHLIERKERQGTLVEFLSNLDGHLFPGRILLTQFIKQNALSSHICFNISLLLLQQGLDLIVSFHRLI
jgi:hypothetical protein